MNILGVFEEFGRVCRPPFIQYPRQAVVDTISLTFFFNRIRDWGNKRPDWLVIDGTVRCRNALITVSNKAIPFDINWNETSQMIEEHFCGPYLSNISSPGLDSNSPLATPVQNGSTDRCGEWKEYSSVTRIRDGLKNCLNGRDEEEQSEMEIEKSCSRVRRHRFHCSTDQPTCLSVTRLGIGIGKTVEMDSMNSCSEWVE